MMGTDVAGAAPLPATAAEERCGEGAAAQEGDHSEDWNERDAEEVLCCPAAEGDTSLAPVTVKSSWNLKHPAGEGHADSAG
jgi:hypothetical protein